MSIQDLVIELPAPKPLVLSATALFLDLDGTLAPIVARPQDVAPDPRRTRLLGQLSRRLNGRLAVVSGRTLEDIDRILEGCVVPVAAVHGLVLRHPLAGVFPQQALLAPRDQGAVDGDHETVFATGYVPHATGTQAAYASVARYVFDVGNWEACRWVVFHGSSGDPRDPHYDDQSATWLRGETVPMPYDWAAVAAAAVMHLVFTPA